MEFGTFAGVGGGERGGGQYKAYTENLASSAGLAKSKNFRFGISEIQRDRL